MREAILTMIQKDIHQISTQSDSQVVVKSINSKLLVPKDIINLVEDIRKLLALLSDNKVRYCRRDTNCDADTIKLSCCTFFLLNEMSIFLSKNVGYSFFFIF